MVSTNAIQKGRAINPFIDWSFKHIFGREESLIFVEINER